jgi:RHS repeat-associated protein
MNNGAITLQYDGDGNRVAKTVNGSTTRYLVDDLNPTGYSQVVEELSGGVAREYTYGLQRISQDQFLSGASAASFYGYDGLGSVRYLANSTGAVMDTYDYDAWGNVVNSTGNTPNVYLYRGEQFDPDLSLYYLRARYYDPLSGRFLSRDPADGQTADPKSLHKYLYAGGGPVNAVDPTGKANLFEFILTKLNVPAQAAADAKEVFLAAKIICVTTNFVRLSISRPGHLIPFPDQYNYFCAVVAGLSFGGF